MFPLNISWIGLRSYALSEINRLNKEIYDDDDKIRAAIASKTDEPSWARSCLKWLTIHDGSTLQSCFRPDLIEISYNDKSRHLKNLQKTTGIPFESMVFFDNEKWNFLNVRDLGVKCVHTPDGMTRKAWKDALKMFD